MGLEFSEYQYEASKTAIYPDKGTGTGLAYAALGLNGEAGEVAEHAKKNIRDDEGKLTPERREKILKELGDVLWYVSAVANECDLSLAEVAGENLAKLRKRQANNTLHGSGDDR